MIPKTPTMTILYICLILFTILILIFLIYILNRAEKKEDERKNIHKKYFDK